jgi:hypothetical protein
VTLYSGQKLFWTQFDKKWKLYDDDHLNYDAPIPNSGCFLFVHSLVNILKASLGLDSRAPNMLVLEKIKTNDILLRDSIGKANKEAKTQL